MNVIILGACVLCLAGSANAAAEIEDAAIKGDIEQVRALVRGGANVNEIDMDSAKQDTALVASIWYRHPEIALFLVEHGANPNLPTGAAGLYPLPLAVDFGYFDVVRALLEKGANIEQVSSDGTNRTPLVWSILKKHEDIGIHLLEKGANPNVVWSSPFDPNEKHTALQSALDRNLYRLVDALIAHGAK